MVRTTAISTAVLQYEAAEADLTDVNRSPASLTPAQPIGGEPTAADTSIGSRTDELAAASEPQAPTLPGVLDQPAQRLAAARAQAAPGVAVNRDRRRSFGTWLNRSRRVLLTLALVWVVAIFDLGFTLLEWGEQQFTELNPVAASVLGGPTQLVMAYKFGLLGLGTTILLALRRHAVAELACWFLLTFKVYVAARWYIYYICVLHDKLNPLIKAPEMLS